MRGEISFDIVIPEDADIDDLEGCYRLDGGHWTVFYFTRRWDGQPGIVKNAIFNSGVRGVNANYPKDKILNKILVKEILSGALGVGEWREVIGPDSLTLK